MPGPFQDIEIKARGWISHVKMLLSQTIESAQLCLLVVTSLSSNRLSQFPWSWVNPLKFPAMDTERPQKKERGEQQVSFLLLCHLPKSKLPLRSLEVVNSPGIMHPYNTYNYYICVYISTPTDMYLYTCTITTCVFPFLGSGVHFSQLPLLYFIYPHSLFQHIFIQQHLLTLKYQLLCSQWNCKD